MVIWDPHEMRHVVSPKLAVQQVTIVVVIYQGYHVTDFQAVLQIRVYQNKRPRYRVLAVESAAVYLAGWSFSGAIKPQGPFGLGWCLGCGAAALGRLRVKM